MPRKTGKGAVTGSKHFDKPNTPNVGAKASEVIGAVGSKASEVIDNVSSAASTVGNGVRAVNNATKKVRRAFGQGSSLVTDTHDISLTKALEISSQYGVGEIDIAPMLGSDPYSSDGDIPEMDAKVANAHKLKIQKQNNALEVRHEKIKQGRKIAQLGRENILLIGDFVDLHTAKIEVGSKVINNQIANTKYQINQSKLEQTEELLIQQSIATQGTLNLTEGIRLEWDLKLEKQTASNDKLKVEVQGAIAETEHEREKLEAKLFSGNHYN
jgi:hypothetical protein